MPSAAQRAILIVLSLAALLMSVWLGVTSLIDPEKMLAACGGIGDCATVLSTKWSRWFELPVVFPAAAVYLGVLLAACGASPRTTPQTQNLATWVLGFSACVAGISAVWFLVLQLGVVGAFCPFCVAIHACGIVIVIMAWFALRRPSPGNVGHLSALAQGVGLSGGHRRVAPAVNFGPSWTTETLLQKAALPAALCVALLVAGQLFSSAPPTHVVKEVQLDNPAVDEGDSTPEPDSRHVVERPILSGETLLVLDPAESQEPPPAVQATGREIELLEGQLKFRIDEFPLLGSRDAPHVVLEIYDYTCPNCRRMSTYLAQALQRYGDQLAVAVLPAPGDRSCNEHLPRGNRSRPDACTYARYAMTVWRINPDAFTTFHRRLMEGDKPMALRRARILAMDLTSRTAFYDRLRQSATRALVERGVELYGQLHGGPIPIVILPGKNAIVGAPKTLEDFFAIMEKELPISPLSE